MWDKLTIQVEITTACNLSCEICLRRNLGIPGRFLPLEDFRRILDSGKFRYVGLHGWGEPLLHPQLFEMISYAESKGISTNLTTNGTLLEGHIGEIFESGLREIAFGAYRKDLLRKILPQIKLLSSERGRRGLRRPKIYLDITLYRGNAGEAAEMVRLAREAGADAVILHRLFNVYGVPPEAECLSDEEEKGLFRELSKLARSLKLELYLPPKHTYPCRIVRWCVFVAVDGKVTPCTYLLDEDLGNALEKGVGEILRSERYREFVRGMREHPICGRCRW